MNIKLIERFAMYDGYIKYGETQKSKNLAVIKINVFLGVVLWRLKLYWFLLTVAQRVWKP